MDTPIKVEPFWISSLASAPVIDFTGQIVRILMADPAVEAEAGQKLEAAREAYKASLDKSQSPYGSSLKEIDRSNDRFWRQSRAILKLSAESPNAETREAAIEVSSAFNQWPDPTNNKYAVEYGILDQLLRAVEALGEEKLRRALVWDWIQALRGGYDAFCALRDQQNQAKTETETGVTARLRIELCDCYEAIVDRLNAIAVLMPDEAHNTLSARINQAIADYRLSVKMGKRKNTGE